MALKYIRLHRADSNHHAAPDSEIWVNPAQVVSVEPLPIPGEEPSAAVQLTSHRFNTVESYDWVVEHVAGYSATKAFGRK